MLERHVWHVPPFLSEEICLFEITPGCKYLNSRPPRPLQPFPFLEKCPAPPLGSAYLTNRFSNLVLGKGVRGSMHCKCKRNLLFKRCSITTKHREIYAPLFNILKHADVCDFHLNSAGSGYLIIARENQKICIHFCRGPGFLTPEKNLLANELCTNLTSKRSSYAR